MNKKKKPMPDIERLIGRIGNSDSGPRLICFGGIHGNEPEGVAALQAVFRMIRSKGLQIKGELVGVAGNLAALKEGRRFLKKDLNRNFRNEILDTGTPLNGVHSKEDYEAREILELINPLLDRPSESTFLDLHSTSAPGGGFSVLSPGDRNEAIGHWLAFPIVFGLEKKLTGTLLGYLYEKGLHGLAFEGGQLGHQDTIAHHEAAIWMTLVCCGLITAEEIEELPIHLDLLSRKSKGLPSNVQLIHREAVGEGEQFVMEEGFKNFDSVSAGQLMGKADGKAIYSPYNGMVLMPLYQSDGEDAFFIVHELI